jgi:rubredoxin
MPVYTRPQRQKLPKRPRAYPVHGKGADRGKYFRCRNCKFIYDRQRDDTGNAECSAGDNHIDYYGVVSTNPYGNANSPDRILCLGDEIDNYQVVMEKGPDGEPKTIRHDFTSNISRGCPKCGMINR